MCVGSGVTEAMINNRAIKPLNKRIDQLENEIAALKSTIDNLKCRDNCPCAEVKLKPTALTREEVVEYQKELEDELERY